MVEKKEKVVYLVPTVDTDPRFYNNCIKSGKNVIGNNFIYEQWAIKKAIKIIQELMEGKAVFTIHTSPLFRNDFYTLPFLKLWEEVVMMGGELALHPHEDRMGGGTYYDDKEHMERIIKDTTLKIRNLSLPLYIFRSGYYAWSQGIPDILKKMDYKIDISCAPGIVNSDRDVNWIGAPRYACYYDKQKRNCFEGSYFVIPLGWDGKGGRFEKNHLFCEKGSLNSLCHVWDTLVEEEEEVEVPSFLKIVSFLYHTFALDDESVCNRITRFIEYVIKHNGVILTASEAKELYDKKTIKLGNSSC